LLNEKEVLLIFFFFILSGKLVSPVVCHLFELFISFTSSEPLDQLQKAALLKICSNEDKSYFQEVKYFNCYILTNSTEPASLFSQTWFKSSMNEVVQMKSLMFPPRKNNRDAKQDGVI
jgi:hypothetical protein